MNVWTKLSRAPCPRVYLVHVRKVFQRGRLSDRGNRRRNRAQKCASKIKPMWTQARPQSLLPSLASTVKPHRRTALHPCRHERVAESFRLIFTLPSRCFRESSWGAMKGILLCAAAACSASSIPKAKIVCARKVLARTSGTSCK